MLLSSTPVVVPINNSNQPASKGNWFWSAISSAGQFFSAHPYLTYALTGVAAGAAIYLVGGALTGRSAEAALGDPASIARVVQTNANLRAEMEATRSSLNEVRDALLDVKLELRRSQAQRALELIQQVRASDMVIRETASLLTTVNTNVLSLHETVVQLAAATGQGLDKSICLHLKHLQTYQQANSLS